MIILSMRRHSCPHAQPWQFIWHEPPVLHGCSGEGIVQEVEVAVEVEVGGEGGEVGGGSVGQSAVGVTPKHDTESEGLGGVDHAEGFGEAAGFHQFDIDAVDAIAQPRNISAGEAAFIDIEGQGRFPVEGGEGVFVAVGEGLLDVGNAPVGKPVAHGDRPLYIPPPIGINADLRVLGCVVQNGPHHRFVGV